jgi:threonine synthase
MQVYGAAVVTCATSEARWTLMRQGVERLGWYPTSGYAMPPVGSTPWGVEGHKTIAYEIAEQLGAAPAAMVVPSGYSDGLFGIWKGWSELAALGAVKQVPSMIAAEPFGPLARALREKLESPVPVDPPGSSVAFSIASRYGTWQGLTALRQSGGLGVALTDEGILEAQRALAREEGIYAEPSSAAALAALMQLASRHGGDPPFQPDDAIVLVITSGGLKDPAASRAWLPEVPAAGPDLDAVLATVRDHYGLALGR